MKLVIDIDENVFTRLFDNGTDIINDDLFKIATSIRKATPLSEVLDSIKEEIYNPNEMDGFENSNIWQKWFVNLIDKYGKEQE